MNNPDHLDYSTSFQSFSIIFQFLNDWWIIISRNNIPMSYSLYSSIWKIHATMMGFFIPMSIFIELDDSKIYRKPLYLMVKTMVSG